MRDFIDNYINSLSAKRRKHIADILSSNTLAKQDIESIAQKLKDTQKAAPMAISGETFGTALSLGSIDSVAREVKIRMSDIFNSSNDISLLLDTYSSILISEIKEIEDEILAIEKAISNYAFTLSDGGFFDYAFTEPFNDNVMRETDINIRLVDRSGRDFSSDEQAVISTSGGVLSLNSELLFQASLSGHIAKSNCSSLNVTGTELGLALNSNPTDGWRLSISSNRPMSSYIYTPGIIGAQFQLELLLPAPTPCSNILITPFSDLSVDILNITLFDTLEQDPSSAETIFDAVVQGAKVLDRPLNIGFPMQNVAKFRVTINQSIYSRGDLPAAQQESSYRALYASSIDEKKKIDIFKPYKKNKKALLRVFNSSFINMSKEERKLFKSPIPQIDFQANRGPLTIDKILYLHNSEHSKDKVWGFESKIGIFLRRMIHEKIFSGSYQVLNDRYIYNLGNLASQNRTFLDRSLMAANNQEFPRVEALEPELNVDILSADSIDSTNALSYNYSIGLRNIEIGSGLQTYRGVFISKPVPAPGDSTEIKLKVDDTNYINSSSSKESKVVTSIEYSISNKSIPTSEEDWIPVLPTDSSNVLSERLFLDNAGNARFRFNASQQGDFAVYKNGYTLDLDQFTIILNTNNNSIKGVKLPIGSFTESDIFTADYTPYANESLINLSDRGHEQSLLASTYDDLGAGETFYSNNSDNVITLSKEPFIDYAQVSSYGTYTPGVGFVGTYQPIIIILADGTVAKNQTNYLGKTQNDLSDFDDTYTAYIHSGKNIIFNKSISDKFTVYYQYLPSNLRFRIIMRVNDTVNVSPVVNTVQIKSKTKKADPRSIF